MNGVHDLGGMHGFGAVEREDPDPPFHAPWERTVNALNRTMMLIGIYNIDEMRHAIERMEPAHYLASGYYEHWFDMLERLLTERGVIAPAELDARTAYFTEHPETPATAPLSGPPPPSLVPAPARPAAHPFIREATAPPRFQAGDAVATRNTQPRGHTRLARYARGKRGVIHRLHGIHVFPDSHAHGLGEQPQPLYSVRFEAGELWGDSAEPCGAVYIDLWESYLTPV